MAKLSKFQLYIFVFSLRKSDLSALYLCNQLQPMAQGGLAFSCVILSLSFKHQNCLGV
jgi:hypothetical protein